jgi:hypothetical protein
MRVKHAKEFSMKHFSKIFGIIAFVMVIGFMVAACGDKGTGDPASPGGGGGDIVDSGEGDVLHPDELVGSWGHNGNAVFTLNADGSGSLSSGSPVHSFTWSNSGHILSLTYMSGVFETVSWTINNSGGLSFSKQTGAVSYVLISSTTPWEKISGAGQNDENDDQSPAANPSHFIFDPATGTITGYTGPGGAVVIPSSIDGVAVTAIGNGAFYNCAALTSVTIPESVTSIGAYYFTSSSYGDIISFQRAYGAFDNCSGLTSVTIPARLAGQFADKFTGYSNLTVILTGTGGIPDGAFNSTIRPSSGLRYDCSKVTRITIEDGVTSIGQNAFSGCSGVTSVYVGAGVNITYTNSFSGCSSLEQVTVASTNATYSSSPEGILCDKEKTVLYVVPRKIRGAVTIPEGITSIGRAFEGRTEITRVIIPKSVETIGEYAFADCTSLSSVTIPNSQPKLLQNFTTINIDGVSTIESYAFDGCISLTTVTIGGPAIYDSLRYEITLLADLVQGLMPDPSLLSQIKVVVSMFSGSYQRGFHNNAFPQGSSGAGGNALKTAYLSGGAGTYTRTAGGSTWTKTKP